MTEDELLAVATRVGAYWREALTSAAREEAPEEGTAGARVAAVLDRGLAELAATGVWGAANRLPSARLWELCGEQLRHGALLHRARFKPRGYAGDDEMLRQICEDWRCDHPLGRQLDAYFQAHAAPCAVRNRARLVAAALGEATAQAAQDELRVASVGSGPAIDLAWGLADLCVTDRARWRVTLLDLDPQALDGASQRLAAWLTRERIVPVRENLYRLPRRAAATEWLAADLIACTGFFDYLNQQDAIDLLALFWRALRPGGRLLVFNFAPGHPSQALMEWIGNWYLVYRDRAAMAALAAAAGIPASACRIASEASGIGLLIDARRG